MLIYLYLQNLGDEHAIEFIAMVTPEDLSGDPRAFAHTQHTNTALRPLPSLTHTYEETLAVNMELKRC